MDALDLSRQAARDLHARVKTAHPELISPYAFACAAAKLIHYEIESYPEGSPILNGARAILDPPDSTILHMECVDPFESALLVAHEIGHVQLGDHEGSHELTVNDTADLDMPIASPVVDYGPRQKRERQMDIFAKELLVPGPFVRSQYLDGLSAKIIAETIGAPEPLVQQQILDALLLPDLKPQPEPKASEGAVSAPNPEQKAAAEYMGTAYLLEAGPGTGKTKTLVDRVVYLLGQDVDPRSILLLTFSNKTANEMKERIAIINAPAAAAMWIGTFHSFGLDIVRRFRSSLGFESDPRLIDKTQAVALMEQDKAILDLDHYGSVYDPVINISDILSAISRAKDEVVDPAGYLALAESMVEAADDEETLIAAQKALEVAHFYRRYEEVKKKQGLIDFGDLVSLPAQLLEQQAAAAESLRSNYAHVLVDEYQDVNRSSVRLLSALKGEAQSLWVVGDSRQSIYRFRGASDANMRRFSEQDFPNGKLGRLDKSYRSTDSLLKAFGSFAEGMTGHIGNGRLTSGHLEGGDPVLFHTFPKKSDQVSAIITQIDNFKQSGIDYSDQAILCSGNDALAEIALSLEAQNVPVLFLGNIFERSEVREILSLLSLLSDPRGAGLMMLGSHSKYNVRLQTLGDLFDHLAKPDMADRGWVDLLDDGIDAPEDCMVALRYWADAIKGYDKGTRPWKFIVSYMLKSGLARDIYLATSSEEKNKGYALWQLQSFVRAAEVQGVKTPTDVLNHIRNVIRLNQDREFRRLPPQVDGLNAVRLMTIHASKGLEFEAVHMPNMNKNVMPGWFRRPNCPPPTGLVELGFAGKAIDTDTIANSDLHQREKECLFYVGMTRAKYRLALYAPKENKSGASNPFSPFLNRIPHKALSSSSSNMVSSNSSSSPLDFKIEDEIKIPASYLKIYEGCPRRFFYNYILQTGGRRQQTSYMRLHEAVRLITKRIINESEPVGNDQVDLMIDDAFQKYNLSEDILVLPFKKLAKEMVGTFLQSRHGLTILPRQEFTIPVGKDTIVVSIQDGVLTSDNMKIYRHIRTGKKLNREDDSLTAAAYQIVNAKIAGESRIEALFLSDGTITPFGMTETKLKKREKKLHSTLEQIRTGHFPVNPSTRTCPTCPAYFHCGKLPKGGFRKKID